MAGLIYGSLADAIARKPPPTAAAFSSDLSSIAFAGFLSVVIVMFLADFFHTTGALAAISEPAQLHMLNGAIKNSDTGVLAFRSKGIFGGLFIVLNITTYLDKLTDLIAGERTVLSIITVGILFISCLFFYLFSKLYDRARL